MDCREAQGMDSSALGKLIRVYLIVWRDKDLAFMPKVAATRELWELITEEKGWDPE
jgi:hypothetical protein